MFVLGTGEILIRVSEAQERVDEEGCGAVIAAIQWKQTRKGRWRRRRGFRLPLFTVSYGGINRAENPWWQNRASGTQRRSRASYPKWFRQWSG
jgi:hypothetical protein